MKNLIALMILVALTLSMKSFATNDSAPDKPVPAKVNLTGMIIDKITGEALAGATVAIEGTDTKTFTDLEGKFILKDCTQGTYTLKVDYISYKETILSNINIGVQQENLEIRLVSNEN